MHLDYLAGEMLCIGKCLTRTRKAMVEEKAGKYNIYNS